jgi:hypothetical protein
MWRSFHIFRLGLTAPDRAWCQHSGTASPRHPYYVAPPRIWIRPGCSQPGLSLARSSGAPNYLLLILVAFSTLSGSLYILELICSSLEAMHRVLKLLSTVKYQKNHVCIIDAPIMQYVHVMSACQCCYASMMLVLGPAYRALILALGIALPLHIGALHSH